MTTAAPTAGGILGRGGVYHDPMWRIELTLSELERRLLRTWELRRLQFIAHAGAPVLTTHQTNSRLEYSLGPSGCCRRCRGDARSRQATFRLGNAITRGWFGS